MKLTKKLELGITVVTALKKYSKPVRTEDLATEIGTTKPFLEQIMRNLRTAGLVNSVRGPGGGYVLASDQAVTAYHVAKAVGRDFGTLSLDEAPLSRLGKALTEAFVNTAI
jgi:Rrf2 family iron-sulfur cluster assembly transcriptional regulator